MFVSSDICTGFDSRFRLKCFSGNVTQARFCVSENKKKIIFPSDICTGFDSWFRLECFSGNITQARCENKLNRYLSLQLLTQPNHQNKSCFCSCIIVPTFLIRSSNLPSSGYLTALTNLG